MVMTSGFTIIGSVVAGTAAYYNALRATDAKIAEANSNIAVLQTQKDDISQSIAEIKSNVDKISDKVDALLINRGINPDQVIGKNAQ